LRDFLGQSLAAAGRSGGGLRLRIQIDISAEELHALRWETLRDPKDEAFFALQAGTPFSRFLAPPGFEQVSLRPKGQLRALVVIANPADLAGGVEFIGSTGAITLAEVPVGDELRRAKEALGNIPSDELVSQPGRPGIVTLPGLCDKLSCHGAERGYDILYLVAHGVMLSIENTPGEIVERPTLILEDENGRSELVDAGKLIEFIREMPKDKRPRLIALASCQSGGKGKVPKAMKNPGEHDEAERSYDRGALAALGPRLVWQAGIPAVLAMQDNISMGTAGTFYRVFFKELLDHGQVDQAASAARNQVRERPDWWVPTLYLCLKHGCLWPTERLGLDPGLLASPRQVLAQQAEALSLPTLPGGAYRRRVSVDKNILVDFDLRDLQIKLADFTEKSGGSFAFTAGGRRLDEHLLKSYILQRILRELRLDHPALIHCPLNGFLLDDPHTFFQETLFNQTETGGWENLFNHYANQDLVIAFWNHDLAQADLQQAAGAFWAKAQVATQAYMDLETNYFIVLIFNENEDPPEIDNVFVLPIPSAYDVADLEKRLRREFKRCCQGVMSEDDYDPYIQRIIQQRGHLYHTCKYFEEVVQYLSQGKVEAR
jgi:hypothetical protein